MTRLNGHKNRVDEQFARGFRIDPATPASHWHPGLRSFRGIGLPYPELLSKETLCRSLVLDPTGLRKDQTDPSEPIPLREVVLHGVGRLIPWGLKRDVEGVKRTREVEAFLGLFEEFLDWVQFPCETYHDW